MKLMKHLFSSLFVATTNVELASVCRRKGSWTGSTSSASSATKPHHKLHNKQWVIKLNINTASASEIQKALIGIGAKKAEAIVQYREKHGNFTMAEQLLEVQGIGKATLEKNRDRIAFLICVIYI